MNMHFSKSVIGILLFSLLHGCGEKKSKEEEKSHISLSPETKLAILNKACSVKLLYDGTPYSDSVHNNCAKIDYGFIHYGDKWRFYFDEKGELKLKSVMNIDHNLQVSIDSAKLDDKSIVVNDTTILNVDENHISVYFLNHYYFMNSRLWRFYPYSVTRNDSIFFYCPQETIGDVIIQGKDTTIMNDLVESAGIHALYIRIPYAKELIGKVLVYGDRTLQIRKPKMGSGLL